MPLRKIPNAASSLVIALGRFSAWRAASGLARWSGFWPVGSAEALREGLQKFPGDGAVSFYERAEFPESQPIAHEVSGSGHGGGARAAVNQSDFAEVIARTKRSDLDAFVGDGGTAGIDEEEGRAARAFHDDGFSFRKWPHLEQTRNLFCLSAVKISEELHALEGGDRVGRRRAGRRRVRARFSRGDSAALQEVKRAVLNRPFDIAPRAVDFLASESEFAQRGELSVIETKLSRLRGGHLLLEGPAAGERTDGDVLAAGLALQHLAGAVEPKIIRNNQAGNHRFAQAPTGFDHALIGSI